MSTQPRQILPLSILEDADPTEDANAGQRYRFEHLTLPTVLRDMYFSINDPGPGDRVPTFDLSTVGGGRFRSSDLAETGPALLIFGPLYGSLRGFCTRCAVLVWSRIAVLGARSAPGDTGNQPRALRDIKGGARGWFQHLPGHR